MKLWRHECCRVFADKLTTLEDKGAFQNELDHQTALVGRAVLEAPEARMQLLCVAVPVAVFLVLFLGVQDVSLKFQINPSMLFSPNSC